MGAPFGIYVHWPYCARICPYCDFNIYKHKGEPGDDLAAAITQDLQHWRDMTGPRTVSSIHFGGGTPSLMRADQIEQIIDAASALWSFAGDIEIGLEANPADADAAKWALYSGAGINRLSVGVQSFDNQVLAFLGRDHDADQARRALDLAARNLPRVSADLIFGHRGQTLADWDADLDKALASGAGHISAYQLTIEAQTAFGKAAQRGDVKAVNGDDSAALYELSQTRLTDAGFEHYEVSNYARPGQQSRHNKIYWLGGDYAGVGPGAHGRLTTPNGRIATVAHMTPAAYIKGAQDGPSLQERDVLSPDDHGNEFVMMGLRLTGGFDEAAYRQISGQALNARAVADLCAMGLLARKGSRIAATESGRMLLDTITRELLT